MYYSIKNVSLHNTKNDCWVIYDNKVYDVTNFLKNHPIGDKVILKKAGTDITVDMNFHSKNAKKILKQYHIGYIKINNFFLNFINRFL